MTDWLSLISNCFDLPSKVYGDKIYNNYQLEDLLKESMNIMFKPLRKRTRVQYVHNVTRKQVETCFSRITNLFPKSCCYLAITFVSFIKSVARIQNYRSNPVSWSSGRRGDRGLAITFVSFIKSAEPKLSGKTRFLGLRVGEAITVLPSPLFLLSNLSPGAQIIR